MVEKAPCTVIVHDNDIQEAIDRLDCRPGKILIPEGVYQIKKSLKLCSGQQLIGCGPSDWNWVKNKMGTTIQYIPDPGTREKDGNYAIKLIGSSDNPISWCVIKNLGINGSPVSGNGRRDGAILIKRGLNIIIEQVFISQFFISDFENMMENFTSVEQLINEGVFYGVGIFLDDHSFFNEIRNCWIANCNALVQFNRSNSNLILGGEYTGGTNSAIVIKESTDVKVFGASIEPKATFAHLEFIRGTHCSIIGNRLETNQDVTYQGPNCHISFDQNSEKNMVFSNQLFANTGGFNKILIKNPGGCGVVERSITISPSEMFTKNKVTHTGGIIFRKLSLLERFYHRRHDQKWAKPAYYRFAVPEDWDRTSPLTYELYFIPKGNKRGKVEFCVKTRDYKSEDTFEDASVDSQTPVDIDGTPGKRYKQIIESPASRVSKEAEYIELVILRSGRNDNYPQSVILQLVIIKYTATYAVYSLK